MFDIVVWCIIGMVLMAVEMFGLPGIGILFSGFAAITVAFFIYLDPSLEGDVAFQLIYFFMSTTVWGALLWIPLSKLIYYGDEGNYENVIGTYATTSEDLIKGVRGKLLWSGTKVRAMVDDSCPEDIIPEKTTVRIVKVVDSVFYVTNEIRQSS